MWLKYWSRSFWILYTRYYFPTFLKKDTFLKKRECRSHPLTPLRYAPDYSTCCVFVFPFAQDFFGMNTSKGVEIESDGEDWVPDPIDAVKKGTTNSLFPVSYDRFHIYQSFCRGRNNGRRSVKTDQNKKHPIRNFINIVKKPTSWSYLKYLKSRLSCHFFSLSQTFNSISICIP